MLQGSLSTSVHTRSAHPSLKHTIVVRGLPEWCFKSCVATSYLHCSVKIMRDHIRVGKRYVMPKAFTSIRPSSDDFSTYMGSSHQEVEHTYIKWNRNLT